MEYPEAENLVFSSALAGVKNILGDLAGVIVALVSIFLIISALKFIVGVIMENQNEKTYGEDYKTAKFYRSRMERGGVEGDLYKRKYKSLISKMSKEEY